MKITHSTKVTASTDSDYITDSYGRKVHTPKPVGGDGENYISYFTGHGYAGPKEILEDAKKRGFSKIFWGSDEAYGYKGMYNGDMYIAYNDAESLPEGYKEDALDAEKRNSIMSSEMIEGATQEEIQKALEEYQKKQQAFTQQLDDLQNDQLKKFNKAAKKKEKKGFFKHAFASEDVPKCHKVNEDSDSINYIVSSENANSPKWMGRYLTASGQIKNVYFSCDTDDWNKAEQEFENVISESYTSCKLLGKAPDNITADSSFTYIQSATQQVTDQLLGEIKAQLHEATHRFLVDEKGFDEEDDPNDITNVSADSMFVVEVYKTEEGAICAEVRAELGYESMEQLADVLNDKVIQNYDSDSYFEQVDPGIMEAFLYVNEVEGSTEVQGASPVTDTRDHWLEPEDADDLAEIDQIEQWIDVDIDADIDIEKDGSYDYDSYDFAKDTTTRDGDYYIDYEGLARKVKLRDHVSVIEDIDNLLVYKLPDITGKHHISGIAHLCYKISGLVESKDDSLIYDYDLDVEFDERQSSIDKFHIE